MSKFQKLAMAGAVAAIGLGMGAATASAYSISGGSYTSTRSGTHTFTFGGGTLTYACPVKPGPPVTNGAIFTGTATGADNTDFVPSLDNCKIMGFPATVTQSGAWNIKVASGPDVNGYYYGDLTIPASSTTTINTPIMGCTYTMAGPQLFRHGVGANVVRLANWTSGIGVHLDVTVDGFDYTTTGPIGCGPASASDGVYTTGGVTSIPGITVS